MKNIEKDLIRSLETLALRRTIKKPFLRFLNCFLEISMARIMIFISDSKLYGGISVKKNGILGERLTLKKNLEKVIKNLG